MAERETSQLSQEQLRAEIRLRRENMRKDIDSLEARLNPDRLKQEAADKVRSETVGRVEEFADNATDMVRGASNDVFETIKKNPMPAALVAVGLGWLFMERRQDNRSGWSQRYSQAPRAYDYGYQADYENRGYRRADAGYDYDQNRVQQAAGNAKYQARQMAGTVQDKAGDIAGSVQDTASQVADTVQEKASQLGDTAQQFAGQAKDQVSDWADTAQWQASRARSRFEDVLEENPLMVGAAALALGAAIGMAIPSTPQEDQFIGQHRDRLMEKAQEAASDTIDKVQHVAERAGDAATQAAKDEAKNQNLTSSK